MKKIITLDLGRANPKQMQFYTSRALYTAYGGAKGGGKTHAVRIKAVMGALRYRGIRILIVRRTYNELQQNHIDPICRLVPSYVAGYSGSEHALTFRNGSVIKFGHYQASSAEREYQGLEYDWIFIDEATQFTERDFRFLGGCLRGVSEAPKRFYITCNPGGVGHAWVKRLFVDRRFKDGENPDDYAFIFASVEDNKFLLASSPAYLQLLDSLPENLRDAYRYGKWDALAGAYFSEFSDARHIEKPFRIPKNWTRYRAFDYGLDMLACLWIAVSPDGVSHIYREVRAPNLVVSEAADAITKVTLPTEEITATFAPPDMWSRQKDTGASMAELFGRGGVPVIRADNARVQGHLQIKELLRGDGEKPSIRFFESCRGLISDLKAIEADLLHPGDCAKTPHDVTHAVDALRYYASSRAADTALSAETFNYRDFV
ncbi:MAG: phage terminase large subunit [Oscillospiraceae bacterium]|jgi:phage terminase large subunit|nr:phage terminase large subunit [Oscillospiraceae bacterium]